MDAHLGIPNPSPLMPTHLGKDVGFQPTVQKRVEDVAGNLQVPESVKMTPADYYRSLNEVCWGVWQGFHPHIVPSKNEMFVLQQVINKVKEFHNLLKEKGGYDRLVEKTDQLLMRLEVLPAWMMYCGKNGMIWEAANQQLECLNTQLGRMKEGDYQYSYHNYAATLKSVHALVMSFFGVDQPQFQNRAGEILKEDLKWISWSLKDFNEEWLEWIELEINDAKKHYSMALEQWKQLPEDVSLQRHLEAYQALFEASKHLKMLYNQFSEGKKHLDELAKVLREDVVKPLSYEKSYWQRLGLWVKGFVVKSSPADKNPYSDTVMEVSRKVCEISDEAESYAKKIGDYQRMFGAVTYDAEVKIDEAERTMMSYLQNVDFDELIRQLTAPLRRFEERESLIDTLKGLISVIKEQEAFPQLLVNAPGVDILLEKAPLLKEDDSDSVNRVKMILLNMTEGDMPIGMEEDPLGRQIMAAWKAIKEEKDELIACYRKIALFLAMEDQRLKDVLEVTLRTLRMRAEALWGIDGARIFNERGLFSPGILENSLESRSVVTAEQRERLRRRKAALKESRVLSTYEPDRGVWFYRFFMALNLLSALKWVFYDLPPQAEALRQRADRLSYKPRYEMMTPEERAELNENVAALEGFLKGYVAISEEKDGSVSKGEPTKEDIRTRYPRIVTYYEAFLGGLKSGTARVMSEEDLREEIFCFASSWVKADTVGKEIPLGINHFDWKNLATGDQKENPRLVYIKGVVETIGEAIKFQRENPRRDNPFEKALDDFKIKGPGLEGLLASDWSDEEISTFKEWFIGFTVALSVNARALSVNASFSH